MESITKAEQNLFYWVNDQAGSFTNNLFKTISSADTSNLYKLSQGFPEEVQVYKRYANEEGFWADLQERILKR